MARGPYFPGKEAPWLIARREELVEERVTGKRLTSWGSSDSTASKKIETSIETLLDWIAYDLFLLDPDTYPLRSRIRRTQVRVHQGSDL